MLSTGLGLVTVARSVGVVGRTTIAASSAVFVSPDPGSSAAAEESPPELPSESWRVCVGGEGEGVGVGVSCCKRSCRYVQSTHTHRCTHTHPNPWLFSWSSNMASTGTNRSFTHTHTHAHTRTHTHASTHAHTHTHTHTHTHLQILGCLRDPPVVVAQAQTDHPRPVNDTSPAHGVCVRACTCV